ncbi:BT1 transmembrane domain-containing protein [Cyclospora cayetanensis]|nr:BT1 transmembrane domain-containing protein [Cyclospora cayetanensis]
MEALLPLSKELNFDGVAYQRIYSLAVTPYALVGFVGSVSDYFPIMGYHKKYYILITNVIGGACSICLVIMPKSMAGSNIIYVGMLYCGIHLHIATADLLCEGTYCKVIQAHPSVGAKLIGFVSMCKSLGHVMGRTVVGPISDYLGTRPLLYMGVPLVLQSLLPAACNFLGEVAGQDKGSNTFMKEKTDKGVFYVALLTSLFACAALVLTLQTWVGYPIIFTAFVVVVLGSAFWFLLSRRLALCTMFFFADRVLHLTISGAVNFYYIAPPDCVPDGPQFDYTYFCTYTAFVAAVGCWFGIYAFQKWCKGWSARAIFWLLNCVRILAALFDYVMTRRLNIAIGIPDKVMYMLGDAIVFHLLLTLSCMTSSLTIARSCPPKLESTVYAIVSSVSNLGSTCSKMLGVVAIELADIRMKQDMPGGCDFKALPNLILVSQCVLPMISIPLAYFMLPTEPLNAAMPPGHRRSRRSIAPTQDTAPFEEPEDDAHEGATGGALSETLAIHSTVENKVDVAVVAGDTGSRPRIVEV